MQIVEVDTGKVARTLAGVSGTQCTCCAHIMAVNIIAYGIWI